MLRYKWRRLVPATGPHQGANAIPRRGIPTPTGRCAAPLGTPWMGQANTRGDDVPLRYAAGMVKHSVGRLAIVIKAVEILEHVCDNFCQGVLRHTNSNK
jgi:hypothetical protein